MLLKGITGTGLFLLATTAAYSQDFLPQLRQPKLKEVQQQAAVAGLVFSSYSGITFSLSGDYFPGGDRYHLAQPLILDSGQPPHISYYYSLPDSTVRLIEYEWNSSEEEKAALTELFDRNAAILTRATEVRARNTTEDHGDWTQQTAIWEKDGLYVKQFIVLGSGTYRVRVLVSW